MAKHLILIALIAAAMFALIWVGNSRYGEQTANAVGSAEAGLPSGR